MAKDFFDLPDIDPVKITKGVIKLQRAWAANTTYKRVAEEHGHETAEAAAAAVRAGRSPEPVIAQAVRRKKEREEREALLASPPALHGSARWAAPGDWEAVVRGREAFDDPRSILLGAVESGGRGVGFVHWDDEGHLLTVAPTRSGKAVTTIIPNLLRYRGSCVVLDPKGELYDATSRFRARVGPVYRIAPFDEPGAPNRHGYNPLAFVRTYSDARSLASLMFPHDPRGQAFFTDDAIAFVAALIAFLRTDAPRHRQTIGTMRQMTALEPEAFREHVVGRMLGSQLSEVRQAAANVAQKFGGTGTSINNLLDTLNSKLALWSDPNIIEATDHHEVDFHTLKDGAATVYVTVPFDLMAPYAPFLKVLLKGALDAMIRNPRKPDIPVLIVLDEFLSLGHFPEFRDAIRTHAGAGVRLWFFLQDLGALQEHYPGNAWQAFMNCSVKQFFGTDEPFTGELIGRLIGSRTIAYRSTNESANVSAQIGQENGSAGVNLSTSENLAFAGKPLLTPDEVIQEMAGWRADGTRAGIVQLRSPPFPIRVRLVPYDQSENCMRRFGRLRPEGVGDGGETSSTRSP